MSLIMWLAAALAALIHILFFCMESLWWTTPAVRRRFGQSEEKAEASKLLAFNQGFYNLFLAVGTLAGIGLAQMGHSDVGLILVYWNCLSMLGAAGVLAASAPQMWRGALFQGAAPLVFLMFATVKDVS